MAARTLTGLGGRQATLKPTTRGELAAGLASEFAAARIGLPSARGSYADHGCSTGCSDRLPRGWCCSPLRPATRRRPVWRSGRPPRSVPSPGSRPTLDTTIPPCLSPRSWSCWRRSSPSTPMYWPRSHSGSEHLDRRPSTSGSVAPGPRQAVCAGHRRRSRDHLPKGARGARDRGRASPRWSAARAGLSNRAAAAARADARPPAARRADSGGPLDDAARRAASCCARSASS